MLGAHHPQLAWPLKPGLSAATEFVVRGDGQNLIVGGGHHDPSLIQGPPSQTKKKNPLRPS